MAAIIIASASERDVMEEAWLQRLLVHLHPLTVHSSSMSFSFSSSHERTTFTILSTAYGDDN